MTTFTHVRELTELPDGTDLQVRVGRQTPIALQVRNGVIYRDRRVIDLWFLEGHVAEGTITLADLRPLENGEWIRQIASERYVYLILRRATDRNGVTLDSYRVAYFREEDGRWSGNGEVPFGPTVFETYQRCEAPSWSNRAVLDLAQRFDETDIALNRLRRDQDNLTTARNNLRYAQDYIDAARRSLGENR